MWSYSILVRFPAAYSCPPNPAGDLSLSLATYSPDPFLWNRQTSLPCLAFTTAITASKVIMCCSSHIRPTDMRSSDGHDLKYRFYVPGLPLYQRGWAGSDPNWVGSRRRPSRTLALACCQKVHQDDSLGSPRSSIHGRRTQSQKLLWTSLTEICSGSANVMMSTGPKNSSKP